MIQVNGIYFKGKLQLERPINTNKPLKVVVTFEEDKEKTSLSLSDFSFLETQELLKDYKGSFSNEVVSDRRSAL
jgi:hypothetical protein